MTRKKFVCVIVAFLLALIAIPLAFAFTSSQNSGGSLTVSKDIVDGDPNAEFTFEIQFYNDDKPVDDDYEYRKESPNPTVFAVLADDGTLNFYKRVIVPVEGTDWDDSKGDYVGKKRHVERVYTGFDTKTYTDKELPPWNEDATKVTSSSTVVDDIAPANTAFWFRNMLNVKKIDLRKLHTENVNTMEQMFYACSSLEEVAGLGELYTGNVRNMSRMFTDNLKMSDDAFAPISAWDVSKVQSFAGMFAMRDDMSGEAEKNALVTRFDLSKWDVSSATDMSEMFFHCRYLTTIGDISKWKTGRVADMSQMFCECRNLSDVSGVTYWDVSNVTTMNLMFAACWELTSLDLSLWNTQKLTNTKGMFRYDEHLGHIGDISDWDMSHVTDMGDMFMNCLNLHTLGDLSKWETGACNDMSSLFERCYALDLSDIDISEWDVSNVNNMSRMFFANGSRNLDLSCWNTGNVINMSFMFSTLYLDDVLQQWIPAYNSNLKTINIRDWDMSNVTNAQDMFSGAVSLSTIYVAPGVDWTQNDMNMNHMFFYGMNDLVGDAGTKWDSAYINGERAKDDNGENDAGYFTATAPAPTYVLASNISSSAVPATVNEIIYTNIHAPAGVTLIHAFDADGDGGIVAWVDSDDSAKLYVSTQRKRIYPIAPETGFTPLAGINDRVQSVDVLKIDTSKVSDLSSSFAGCPNLDTLDISSWDVSNVKTADNMFADSSLLETVYVGLSTQWDSLQSSTGMFSNCESLTGGLGTKFDNSTIDAARALIDGMDDNKGYFTPKITVSFVNAETGEKSEPILFKYGMKALVIEDPYRGWSTVPDSSEAEILSEGEIVYVPSNIKDIVLYPAGDFAKEDGIAFAVYSSDDRSLCFYKREQVPTDGDFFSGHVVTAVFTGLEDEKAFTAANPLVPPTYANAVETVSIRDKYIKPIHTDYWFYYLTNVREFDVGKLDTSETVSTTSMFNECHSVQSLDLSTWNVSKLRDASGMFFLCKSLETIRFADAESGNGWEEENVSTLSSLENACNMFSNCYALQWNPYIDSWNMSSLRNASAMFANCNSFRSVDLSGWNTANLSDASYMFYYCEGVTDISLSKWNVQMLANTDSMFANCHLLGSLNVDWTNVTALLNVASMFRDCHVLSSLSMNGWDDVAASIRNANTMFMNCRALLECVAASWTLNTDVEDYAMTRNCPAFGEHANGLSLFANTRTIDSSANVEQIRTYVLKADITDDAIPSCVERITYADYVPPDGVELSNAFDEDEDGGIVSWIDPEDSSHLIVSTCVTGQKMLAPSVGFTPFAHRTDIVFANLENVDVSIVSDISGLFMGCQFLQELRVSTWNPVSSHDWSDLFNGCASLTMLDLSNWNSTAVSNYSNMFAQCVKLERIIVGKNWCAYSSSNGENMFEDCVNIVGENGSQYVASGSDGVLMANVDGLDGKPGYLTLSAEVEEPSIDYGTLKIVNGRCIIKMKASEKITILGLPPGTTYVVTELPSSGWTEINPDTPPKNGVIEEGQESQAPFVNTFNTNKPSINIRGIALLDGREVVCGSNAGDDFEYDLIEVKPTGETVIATRTAGYSNGDNSVPGVIDFSGCLDSLEEGNHLYVVRRNTEHTHSQEILYDSDVTDTPHYKRYEIAVNVIKNEDGTYSADVTSNADGTEDGYVYGTMTFKNMSIYELPNAGGNNMMFVILFAGAIVFLASIVVGNRQSRRSTDCSRV